MSTLLEIEIGYGATLTDKVVAMLREASVTQVDVTRHGESAWLTQRPIVSVDALAKLQALLGPRGDVTVKRVISNSSTEALERFGQRNTVVENTRCTVAVAGLGLLTVDLVRVETDCCTDHLQSLLSEGWRILAVCVQPDQRRPDYVLGRTNLGGVPERKVERDRPMPMPSPPDHFVPEPSPLDRAQLPAPTPEIVVTERKVFEMVHRGGLDEPKPAPVPPARHGAEANASDEDIPF